MTPGEAPARPALFSRRVRYAVVGADHSRGWATASRRKAPATRGGACPGADSRRRPGEIGSRGAGLFRNGAKRLGAVSLVGS